MIQSKKLAVLGVGKIGEALIRALVERAEREAPLALADRDGIGGALHLGLEEVVDAALVPEGLLGAVPVRDLPEVLLGRDPDRRVGLGEHLGGHARLAVGFVMTSIMERSPLTVREVRPTYKLCFQTGAERSNWNTASESDREAGSATCSNDWG